MTNGDSASNPVTHSVVAGSAETPIVFRGEAHAVVNATGPTATVPAAVRAGDGLLLFATLNIA